MRSSMPLAFLWLSMLSASWAQEGTQPPPLPAEASAEEEEQEAPERPLTLQEKYPHGDAEGKGHYLAVKGMLNPNSTMLVQMLLFGITVIIMNRLVFRPAMKILDEREDELKRHHDEQHEFEKQSKALKVEYEQKLHDVRAEASTLLNQHERKAKEVAAQAIQQRQDESKAVIAETRAAFAAEMADQKDVLDRQVPELAKNLASKLLGRQL